MTTTRSHAGARRVAASLALGVAACGGDDEGSGVDGGIESEQGAVAARSASTAPRRSSRSPRRPAELFNEEQPDVKVTVGQSGTGGGFERFCAGETDISDASRPIKDDEEAPVCEKAGITYKEVQVANDGIAVVTNKDLTVDCLTVDQLKRSGSRSRRSRTSAEVDAEPPGHDAQALRPRHGLGHVRLLHRRDQRRGGRVAQGLRGLRGRQPARHRRRRAPRAASATSASPTTRQNADKLNLVGVGEDAASCKKPDAETIQDGSYKPLSRPLFMYPSDKALQRPEVKAFMEFVVDNQAEIAKASKIVPMTDAQAAESKAEVDKLAGAVSMADAPRRIAAPRGSGSPHPDPHAAVAFEAGIKVALIARPLLSVVTTVASSARCCSRRSRSSARSRSRTSCSAPSGRRHSRASRPRSGSCRCSGARSTSR